MMGMGDKLGGLEVQREQMEQVMVKVRLDVRDSQGSRGMKGLEESLEQQGIQEMLGIGVLMDNLEPMDYLVRMDRLEHLDSLGHQDKLGMKERLDILVPQGVKDKVAKQDQQVLLGNLEVQAYQARLANRAISDKMDNLGKQETEVVLGMNQMEVVLLAHNYIWSSPLFLNHYFYTFNNCKKQIIQPTVPAQSKIVQ